MAYPSSAISAGEEGTVFLVAWVTTHGRVVDARVEKSSGHPDLDATALRSIAQWSFQPGTRGGQPVAQWVRVPVNFRLTQTAHGPSGWLDAVEQMGHLLVLLGELVFLVGFAWSMVLAKRESILWLSFMVALWFATYPLFLAIHWRKSRWNLAVVLLGIAIWCAGLYLAHPPSMAVARTADTRSLPVPLDARRCDPVAQHHRSVS